MEDKTAKLKTYFDRYISKIPIKDVDDNFPPFWVENKLGTFKPPVKKQPRMNPFLEPLEPKVPKEKDENVVCCDGKKYPEKECVWYDGKWFHMSQTDYIVIDAISGDPLHRRRAMQVITKLTIENGIANAVLGFVSQFNYEICVPYTSDKYGVSGLIINEASIEGWDYKESISEGLLVDKDRKDNSNLANHVHYDTFKNYYNNLSAIDDKTQMKMGLKSPSFQITEGVRYSFGVELEIARGYIPAWKRNKFNISAMRDGSLNAGAGGLEIVTGVLKGDTGLYHLQEICHELAPRTLVDKYTSIHTHIGGLEFTNKFIVNIYLLCQLIEKDMLAIVPPSRRNNQYCRNLKKFKLSPALNNDLTLKEDYFKLFEWISFEKIQNPTFEYNKTKQHPLGAKCGYNHDTPRYCWLNLVPAMFNTRGDLRWKTIEIRIHEGSTNYQKINNWVLLCMAIVKFADKYPEFINDNITINDILLKIYPKKGVQLIEYFNKRKETFNSSIFNEADWYREDNRFKTNKLKQIKELIENV